MLSLKVKHLWSKLINDMFDAELLIMFLMCPSCSLRKHFGISQSCCRYDVICFHGISWLKSPFFSTGDSALASMPAFQPPFLRPSLPVGFLETVDLLPAYVQFCRRVPGCDFALCRFFDDRFDVFCCSVSSC